MDQQIPYARIWYGHGLVTTPDGQSVVAELGAGTDGNPNKLANRWVLARQSLVMPEGQLAAGPVLLQSNGANIPVFVSGIGPGVNVAGTDYPDAGNRVLYRGLSDMTNLPLTYPSSGGGPTNPINALISRSSVFPGDQYPLYTGQPKLGANGYDERSLNFLTFCPTGANGELRRLWVNPRPSSDDGAMNNLAAWQVAQMHGLLASNVSDFIVDFAADLDNDVNNTIDTNPLYVAGNDVHGRAYAAIPAGAITWYTSPRFANTPGTANYDSLEPLTLAANAGWPAGTPYSSTNGPYYGAAGHANANGGAYVFRHDDTQAWVSGDPNNSKWPYLLRIRYRMHDKDSLLTAGQAAGTLAPGRWQELIVPVNRP